MKGFYVYISVFMATLFCILCVTGCSVIQKKEPMTTNLITPTEAADDQTMGLTVSPKMDGTSFSSAPSEVYPDTYDQDPPIMMIFQSWDEYGDFRSLSEKSDSEIETVLKEEYSYLYYDGIQTKKDVEKYKEIIDSLYILQPKNDKLKLKVVYYYIDYEYLFISYSDGSAPSSYDNLFYFTAWHKSNETPSREYDLQVKIDDYSIYRYKDKNDYFWGEICGLTDIGIRYCGKNPENAPEMLQNCFEIIKISDIFQDK